MYPPQTSLIPLGVILSSFVWKNGLSSIFGIYPYWYQGVPFLYIASPLYTLMMYGIKTLLPTVSFFQISYFLIFTSFLVAALGWAVWVKIVSKNDYLTLLTFFGYLLSPFKFVYGLSLAEGSFLVATSFIPWVIACSYLYVRSKNLLFLLLAVTFSTATILTSIYSIPILLAAITTTSITASFMITKKGKVKFLHLFRYLELALIIFGISIIIAVSIFGPQYFLHLLTNPSIGGQANILVAKKALDILRAVAPFVAALFTVYLFVRIRSRLVIWLITWLLVFIFLTFIRFIGNPVFWQDWSSWSLELEVACIILGSYLSYKRRSIDLLVILMMLLAFSVAVSLQIGHPNPISAHPPAVLSPLTHLPQTEEAYRVFLSGTPVFWQGNNGNNLLQVRGGEDIGSTNTLWRDGAYALRESSDPEVTYNWARVLGVSYVIVYGQGSKEYWKDFKHIAKWNAIGEVVWQGPADEVLYKLPESGIAWIVDLEKLSKSRRPSKVEDAQALASYVSALKKKVIVKEEGSSYAIEQIHLDDNEAIVVMFTFDSRWKAEGGELEQDPYGYLLIKPKSSTFRLRYY